MRAALRTEYRKIVTTRMWWVLTLVTFGYLVFLGAVMAFSLTFEGATMTTGGEDVELAARAVADTVYTLAPSLGYVFPLVIGTLAVTGEFRHQTITPTLLAEPSRTRVLAAKLAGAVPVGLLVGVAGTVATVGAGAAVFALRDAPTFLGEADTWRTVGASVLALTVWAVVGVGFGSLLTHQVAAVVVVLAFTQFVEPVARIVLALWDATDHLAKFLPGAAGEAIAGGSLYSATGLAELLPWWQGLLVLLGYALLFALLGRVTTLRRDIT